MDSRYKDTVLLVLLSLGIVSALIILIILIFIISRKEDMLVQLFQNTAKGEIAGIAFTAIGPFAMWIVTYLILRYLGVKSPELKSIKLYLAPDPTSSGAFPQRKVECNQAECFYSISSLGKCIITKKKIKIQTTPINRSKENFEAPFIRIPSKEKDDKGKWITIGDVEDLEIDAMLHYEGGNWLSDTWSRNEGRVTLHEAHK